MCVFAGVGLAFIIIYLMFILNKKLKEEDLLPKLIDSFASLTPIKLDKYDEI